MAVRMAATAVAKPAFCPFGQVICLVHQHNVCFTPTIPSSMWGRKVLQLNSVVSLRRMQKGFGQISGHHIMHIWSFWATKMSELQPITHVWYLEFWATKLCHTLADDAYIIQYFRPHIYSPQALNSNSNQHTLAIHQCFSPLKYKSTWEPGRLYRTTI